MLAVARARRSVYTVETPAVRTLIGIFRAALVSDDLGVMLTVARRFWVPVVEGLVGVDSV